MQRLFSPVVKTTGDNILRFTDNRAFSLRVEEALGCRFSSLRVGERRGDVIGITGFHYFCEAQ